MAATAKLTTTKPLTPLEEIQERAEGCEKNLREFVLDENKFANNQKALYEALLSLNRDMAAFPSMDFCLCDYVFQLFEGAQQASSTNIRKLIYLWDAGALAKKPGVEAENPNATVTMKAKADALAITTGKAKGEAAALPKAPKEGTSREGNGQENDTGVTKGKDAAIRNDRAADKQATHAGEGGDKKKPTKGKDMAIRNDEAAQKQTTHMGGGGDQKTKPKTPAAIPLRTTAPKAKADAAAMTAGKAKGVAPALAKAPEQKTSWEENAQEDDTGANKGKDTAVRTVKTAEKQAAHTDRGGDKKTKRKTAGATDPTPLRITIPKPKRVRSEPTVPDESNDEYVPGPSTIKIGPPKSKKKGGTKAKTNAKPEESESDQEMNEAEEAAVGADESSDASDEVEEQKPRTRRTKAISTPPANSTLPKAAARSLAATVAETARKPSVDLTEWAVSDTACERCIKANKSCLVPVGVRLRGRAACLECRNKKSKCPLAAPPPAGMDLFTPLTPTLTKLLNQPAADLTIPNGQADEVSAPLTVGEILVELLQEVRAVREKNAVLRETVKAFEAKQNEVMVILNRRPSLPLPDRSTGSVKQIRDRTPTVPPRQRPPPSVRPYLLLPILHDEGSVEQIRDRTPTVPPRQRPPPPVRPNLSLPILHDEDDEDEPTDGTPPQATKKRKQDVPEEGEEAEQGPPAKGPRIKKAKKDTEPEQEANGGVAPRKRRGGGRKMK